MGTDIHWVWEKKTARGWKKIDGLSEDRDYLLFAWLADVRNGFGFAGAPSHVPIPCIHPCRGLPSDSLVRTDPDSGACVYGRGKGAKGAKWLGEHSFSWLTGAEILAAPKVEVLRRIGIVTLEEFFACSAEGRIPREWYGGLWGPSVVVSKPSDVTEKTTHVQMTWDVPQPLQWFVDAVKALQEQHGEVRVLFGFDS